jgi:para-aminobenzoate synthetase
MTVSGRQTQKIRTLLIDNYDSYTYNLFQLIAAVNGAEPVVMTNSSPLVPEWLDYFDNVVISPGPGHPAEQRDFGISADVIARSGIPVLGVCLGHQGIAAGEGAIVSRAPRARHGHLTRVRHNGAVLFEGIPQDFVAVRYHSLCVPENLPGALEPIAWAEDGVVMALRHRSRPLWGVQFHPESVATHFGTEFMVNFKNLTARFLAGREQPAHLAPMPGRPTGSREPVPGPASASLPAARPASYRLQVRVLGHAVDTEAAFTRLFASSRVAFWLDSARAEPGLARFSFLGDAAGPLAETAAYRVDEQAVAVHTAAGTTRVPGTIFDYLERALASRSVDGPALPFDFQCGYAGYFGYELKADCGSPNAHRADTPDAMWIFADRMIAVDHEEGKTYLLALDDTTPRTESAARAWLIRTTATLEALRPELPDLPPGRADVAEEAVDGLLVRDRDQYLTDIAACKRKLLAGESYEICLTNSVRMPATEDGYSFYRRLRRVNPAPYGAYLKLDGVIVACSSPERFLRVDRTRIVESKPIKGTEPRGRTPAEDERLRAELTASAKTRAENLMIVDLVRNDLGRVCEVGSVHVPRLMATESYETVHQLVSTVHGRLRGDASVIDCVRACFPGGSMTGAPKLRTLEIIDSLETEARGVYSGAIGFLGCNQTADLNVVIRTAVLADGEWRLGAGGAIVLDSDPVAEYAEMVLKAVTSLRASQALTRHPDFLDHAANGWPARARMALAGPVSGGPAENEPRS